MPHASPSPPPFLHSWPSPTGGGADSMLPSQRGDPYLEPTPFDSESPSALEPRERVPSYDPHGPAYYRADDYLYQGPSLRDSTGRPATFFHGGPRRSSSFGTLTSPLPFGAPSPASSLPYDESFLARSRPGSASAASDMPDAGKPPALLPPAGSDDFGSRRQSQEDLWSSRTRWMTEQGMYRDSLDDALAVEELSPSYFMQSPGGSNPFSPTTSSLRRSTSTYSMSSSHRSAQAGPYARPITPTPRGETSVRRRSITSDQESASPSKRSSPRKVAQVTTVLDSNGSPTKSIRRISKLNLDASPSKQESPSTSPRKSPRKDSRGAMATGNVPIRPAPDTTLSESSVREVEQILGEIGPVLEPAPLGGESANRAPRRVSFAAPAAGQARVPSVLLPPAPIDVSMSRVALEHEQFVDDPDALEKIDLLPQDASSGRVWRPSFALPTPPDQCHESTYASDDYYRPQTQTYPPAHYPVREVNPAVSSFTLPANPHARSQSAFSHGYTAYASGLAVPASPFAPQGWSDGRRRSSASSYEYVPASTRRYPVPATAMWSPDMPMHADHESNPPSYQDPRMYRLPAYGSSSASSSSPSPASDSRPATPPPVSRIAPIPITPKGGSPAKVAVGAAKSSPSKKKRSPAKSKRQPGAMFVNYSAVDAKKLLNGVAPSGSTRKRREEEEARRRALVESRDAAAEHEAHSA